MPKFAEPLINSSIQTILVDSRGCGSSSGNKISFGYYESKELTLILNRLEKKNEINHTIDVQCLEPFLPTVMKNVH